MSKVYSYRLSDDNPREAQAREVIEAWACEGYSLRHMIVNLLLSSEEEGNKHNELNSVVEYLHEMVLSLDGYSQNQPVDDLLPHSFIKALKQSVRSGIKSE